MAVTAKDTWEYIKDRCQQALACQMTIMKETGGAVVEPGAIRKIGEVQIEVRDLPAWNI